MYSCRTSSGEILTVWVYSPPLQTCTGAVPPSLARIVHQWCPPASVWIDSGLHDRYGNGFICVWTDSGLHDRYGNGFMGTWKDRRLMGVCVWWGTLRVHQRIHSELYKMVLCKGKQIMVAHFSIRSCTWPVPSVASTPPSKERVWKIVAQQLQY